MLHKGAQIVEAWQRHRLYPLDLTEEGLSAYQKIELAANELGFNYCSIGLRAPFPISNPIIRIASNSSEEWQKEYISQNYISIDPIVKHAFYSQDIMVWSEEVHANSSDLWEARRAYGQQYGLSLPTRGARGVIGVLSLARPEQEISASELEEKKFHLAWLAQIAHSSMEAHCLPELTSISAIKLTDREISVLRLLAEGKTSEDIAETLHITRRTIDFHITNTVAKLGVENRTAATAMLAVLGLL